MTPTSAPPADHLPSPTGRRAELLAAYDEQLRGRGQFISRSGAIVETDGPVLRIAGTNPRAMVMGIGLTGLNPEAADRLIERQRRFFATRGEPVEWKTWSHDQPEDFGARLERAGFHRQEEETVMVGLASDVGPAPALPAGVEVRAISSEADFDKLAQMMSTVWGEDHSWLAKEYRSDHESRPDAVLVFVAEVGGQVVSGAKADLEEGTEFCTLWGGATVPEWRHQGIYRALVAIRAQLALERGYRYLEVDASPESLPVLERLGLMPVTTSTPNSGSRRRPAPRWHPLRGRTGAGPRRGPDPPSAPARTPCR